MVVWMAFLAGTLLQAGYAPMMAQPPEKSPSPIGAWDVWGQDKAKTMWLGTLVLSTDDQGGLAGHVDWSGSGGESDGAAGREYVTATYDPKTRALKMKGVKLAQANRIVLGTYTAELSADGMGLHKARWEGDGMALRGWEAKRVVFK